MIVHDHQDAGVHDHQDARVPGRVVVLGGNGFLGRHLVARLQAKGIETLKPSSRNVDLCASAGTAALRDVLRPSDAIVMLAASNTGARLGNDDFVQNAKMAVTLCETVRASGCAHLIYLSSDSVYPLSAGAINEDTGTNPQGLYALMHLARETMLCSLQNVPIATFRVTQVYGFDDPHEAYGPVRMVRSALREQRIVLYGSGEETRDHIHVDDVASLILMALEKRSTGLANLATGRSTSFSTIADLVAEACGGTVKIEREPRRMPVFHRSFDIRRLQDAFPAFSFREIGGSIAEMVNKERDKRSVQHSS